MSILTRMIQELVDGEEDEAKLIMDSISSQLLKIQEMKSIINSTPTTPSPIPIKLD